MLSLLAEQAGRGHPGTKQLLSASLAAGGGPRHGGILFSPPEPEFAAFTADVGAGTRGQQAALDGMQAAEWGIPYVAWDTCDEMLANLTHFIESDAGRSNHSSIPIQLLA